MRSLSTRATGLIILVLGIWGGLVPFVGPYFHFALGPDKSWTWTTGRLYLSVIPGIVAVIGGLMLMRAGPRPSARLGALLALVAGFWFAIGPEVSILWNAAGAQGAAHGSRDVRMLEILTYHIGLGVLMAALAGYALPRFPARRLAAAEAGGAATGAVAGAGAGAAVTAESCRHRNREAVAAEEDAATVRREPVAAEEDAATRGHDPVADDERAGTREPVDAPGQQSVDEPVREPIGVGASRTGTGNGNGSATPGNGSTAPGNGATTAGNASTTVRRRQGGLLSSLLRR